jgi:carboxypeptidase A1
MFLVDLLALLYGQDDRVTNILNKFEVHSIPSLNPDGYEYSHTTNNMWRKSRKPNAGSTAVGTDLNRNFCQGWGGGGSSGTPSSDTYRGTACLDNVETKQIVDYWTETRPIVMMDIHAYGNMWLQPYGTSPTSACISQPRNCGVASDEDYTAQTGAGEASAAAIRATTGLNFAVGPITYVIYQASGGSCDHAYAQNGVKYAHSPEVRGNSFQPATSNLEPSNRELFAAVLAQLEYIATREGL